MTVKFIGKYLQYSSKFNSFASSRSVFVVDERAAYSATVPCSCQHSEQAVQVAEGAADDSDVQGRPEVNDRQAEGGTGSTFVNAE